MCRAVRCKHCEKTTWAGCGLHVDQVKARVPAADWCVGHVSNQDTAAATPGTWLRRLLGHSPRQP